MFSQLFGNYLVKEGVLSEDSYRAIVKEQSEARVKLGMIAVAEKMLSEQQADEINRLQQQMDMRFGDIAVEKEYLTLEQVEMLLEKQTTPYMQFLQLLVEKTDIQISKIDEYLEDFQSENGFDENEMEALKKDDIDVIVPIYAFAAKPYVTDIVALVLRNITRFVTNDYYIGHIRPVSQFDYRSFSGQKCEGDHSVCIGFAVKDSSVAFEKVARGYVGSAGIHNSAEAYDAVGEFTNCVSGLFATALSKKGISLEIMPQFAYENQVAQGSAYVIPIYIEGDELLLYISVDSEITIGNMPLTRKIQTREGSVVTDNCKGTVLVVDDSGMSRKMLRNLLEEDGYAVVAEAADGMEGVLAYKQYMPDIVTLDITMPNMSGTEALVEIKDYNPEAKVIMITAAGQQNKIIEALKNGAEKFVTKPFDREEVLKCVGEMIQ